MWNPACAATNPTLRDVADYDQYRKVRLGETFEARLVAGWTYLRRFPEGAWREEVSRWFEAAEERYRRQAWDSQARLNAYLRVLPDGPHVASVRRRLANLEREARAVAAEETSFMRRERERQRLFEAAKVSRTEFRREFASWLELLANLRDFGKPKQEWSPELRQQFFDTDPPALCSPDACEKTLRLEFDIPVHEGLTTRTADFSVVLTLEGERLMQAELRGYDMWSRLGEAASLEAVDSERLQTRAEAIGSAVSVVSMTIELGFPNDSCDAEAISPDVLVRQCEGRRLVMSIGESLTVPDRLVVTQSAKARAGRDK